MREKCHMCCQKPGNHGNMCPLLQRNVFTRCVSTTQAVLISAEVTFLNDCVLLDQSVFTDRSY